jgi:hypothetical protein
MTEIALLKRTATPSNAALTDAFVFDCAGMATSRAENSARLPGLRSDQTLDAFLLDGIHKLIQRILIGFEEIVPHGGIIEFIDDLQNPAAVAAFINFDFYRMAIALDGLAQR